LVTLKLIAFGIIIHDLVYYSSLGKKYFRTSISPVFGLNLTQGHKTLLHILITINAIVLIIYQFPQIVLGYSLFILFTIACASFSKRLPNHFAAIWFFLLSINIANIFLDRHNSLTFINGVIQAQVLLIYLFSFLHKLNTDYINPNRSCGRLLVIEYLIRKNIYNHFTRLISSVVGIWTALSIEILIPLFLMTGRLGQLAVVGALVVHCVFGLVSHIQFSIVMLAGLCAFYSKILFSIHAISVVFIIGGILLCLTLGVQRFYKVNKLMNFAYLLFGAVYFYFGYTLFNNISNFQISLLQAFNINPMLYSIIVILFILNGLCPYIDLKFDFSFAMFSNLKPGIPNHLFFPAPRTLFRPRYFLITNIEVVPSFQYKNIVVSLKHYFPDWLNEVYSVKYFIDVVDKIKRDAGDEIQITYKVMIFGTSEAIRITSKEEVKMKLFERLSVFPYKINIYTPFCT
jgi:hypothetical protein